MPVQESPRRHVIEEFLRACRAARGPHRPHGDPHAAVLHAAGQATPACLRLLGLTWPCTTAEVKRAFRRQAKRLHPDVGGDSEAFQRLCRAYHEALALLA
ncbi:MAG: hypothetical protein KatS3mg131_2440 [Candidatus Tectimicrobiota bacterium]|nr:MAG: hypothetical protein KatS3mg131_2440 [Candidatus Tectomicrobia bacterium]